jgi:hypothetical protein
MTKNDALNLIRDAMERQRARQHELAVLLEGTNRSDAEACRRVLLHYANVEDVVGVLSTSEAIAVALAFGRLDLCPEGYQNFRYAWQRLDDRQRRLVDIVATADWQEPVAGTAA